MNNYLILGSNSAIATYFIERLQSEGNIVWTLSSSRGKKIWAYDMETIRNAIGKHKPQIIVNFVGSFSNDYSESYRINVLVSKSLLDTAIESKFDGKIILIGSAAEYGIQNIYTESCVEKPQSIYGLTKLMQHSLFQYYTYTTQIKMNYIRLFNVISTNLSEKLFVGNFTRQIKLALKGKIEKLEVGNLNHYRDYLLIDDVYTGSMKIIENWNNGEVYNLGMGKAILIRDFVERVISILNLHVKLVSKRLNSVGNIKDEVVADITKIKNIGWIPKFDYKSLIREYCRGLKEEIFNEKS